MLSPYHVKPQRFAYEGSKLTETTGGNTVLKSIQQKIFLLAVIVSSIGAPLAVQAGTSASFGVSNMYLWRGKNLTPDGGAISGSLDYKLMGLHAGIWMSTEHQGHETDLTVGYGAKLGPIDVDATYWKILYPENQNPVVDNNGNDPVFSKGSLQHHKLPLDDTDYSEVSLSASWGPVSFAGYFGVESGAPSDNYYTLKGTIDKYSLLVGSWDTEDPAADAYAHLTFGYAATENLSFAVSMAFSEIGDDNGGVEEDPLFQVTYALNFDLSKK